MMGRFRCTYKYVNQGYEKSSEFSKTLQLTCCWQRRSLKGIFENSFLVKGMSFYGTHRR